MAWPTVIASLLAGGEWMDDVNALQVVGDAAGVLGMAPAAASTVGVFLRACSRSGTSTKLDAVQEVLTGRQSKSITRDRLVHIYNKLVQRHIGGSRAAHNGYQTATLAVTTA